MDIDGDPDASMFLNDANDGRNINDLYNQLQTKRRSIDNRIHLIEYTDMYSSIITHTIDEKQKDFTKAVGIIKEKKEQLLQNTELDKSELSFQISDFEKRISELENEHVEKIYNLSQQKIEQQTQIENTIAELDERFEQIQSIFSNVLDAIENQKTSVATSEIKLVDENYNHIIDEFHNYLIDCQKKQSDGWKTQDAEMKLSAILHEKGLQITKSGLLLTLSGNQMTYEEAQEQGYFKKLEVPVDKFLPFVNKDKLEPADSDVSESSKGSSTSSKMSSEDVKYLKSTVGRPLTLALAEITAKQPRDPIHYLGHYLFKYRYNQELEEVQKREVDELNNERKILAQERWHKFVEEEARNAVMDMIIRAEQLIYQNELRRIEEEMAAMALEEEEAEQDYLDEARDKFDESIFGKRASQ